MGEALISLLTANGLAAFFALSYVGCLYVSQHTRITFSSNHGDNNNGRSRARDDPDVIRARLIAVSISTLSSYALLYYVVLSYMPELSERSNVPVSVWQYLGAPFTLGFLPSLTAPVLFLGPLYVMFLSKTLPLQEFWSYQLSFVPKFASWIGLRNHIVAPITEEVVFRTCILAAYHLAGCSVKKMIFLSPLWFGVAHIHHGWAIYNENGRNARALQIAVLSVTFQTLYTTLFGFHCAFLLLRTGSLIPPIASHIFCNLMGFPGFTSDLDIHPTKRTSIILAYLLGVVGYAYTLGSWTRGFDSVYWPSASH